MHGGITAQHLAAQRVHTPNLAWICGVGNGFRKPSHPGDLVFGKQMFQPQIRKMLAQAILRKPLLQAVVIRQVDGLVLPGAGEHGLGAFAGGGVHLPLQALRAHAFEHALHAAVYRAGGWRVLGEFFFEVAVTQVAQALHQAAAAHEVQAVHFFQVHSSSPPR